MKLFRKIITPIFIILIFIGAYILATREWTQQYINSWIVGFPFLSIIKDMLSETDPLIKGYLLTLDWSKNPIDASLGAIFLDLSKAIITVCFTSIIGTILYRLFLNIGEPDISDVKDFVKKEEKLEGLLYRICSFILNAVVFFIAMAISVTLCNLAGGFIDEISLEDLTLKDTYSILFFILVYTFAVLYFSFRMKVTGWRAFAKIGFYNLLPSCIETVFLVGIVVWFFAHLDVKHIGMDTFLRFLILAAVHIAVGFISDLVRGLYFKAGLVFGRSKYISNIFWFLANMATVYLYYIIMSIPGNQEAIIYGSTFPFAGEFMFSNAIHSMFTVNMTSSVRMLMELTMICIVIAFIQYITSVFKLGMIYSVAFKLIGLSFTVATIYGIHAFYSFFKEFMWVELSPYVKLAILTFVLILIWLLCYFQPIVVLEGFATSIGIVLLLHSTLSCRILEANRAGYAAQSIHPILISAFAVIALVWLFSIIQNVIAAYTKL